MLAKKGRPRKGLRKTFAIAAILGAMTLVQACIHPFPKELAGKADRAITFEMLRADPDRYKGRYVILGGSIVETTNVDQGTMISVRQAALDYWDKPIRTNASGGHFLVYTPDFLDPSKYAPGRDITVVGQVGPASTRVPWPLESAAHEGPLLTAKGLKLWPSSRSYEQPEWLDPLYNMKRVVPPGENYY